MPAVAALRRRQILITCSHQRDFAALHTLRFRRAVPIHFLNLVSRIKFPDVMSRTLLSPIRHQAESPSMYPRLPGQPYYGAMDTEP